MKTTIAGFLFFSTVFFFGGNLSAGAQTIYVKIHPAVPVVVRPVAPGPRYVWIAEEWTPRGQGYVYSGGYWAAPPNAGWIWVPGHWKRHHHGDYWIPGHWRK